jgi:hypothetical protein
MKNDPIRSDGTASLTLLGAALALIVLGSTVQAAAPLEPKAADRAAAAMAGKDPQTTSSVTSDSLPPNCQRSRKKFFVADEGWIVRKVTTCY